MSDRERDDPVATYVRVLREFGLENDEIVALHGDDPGVSDPDAIAHVRLVLDDHSPVALAEHIPSMLARSDRGIEAPAKFWRPVPAVQLSEVVEPYGFDLSFGFQGEGPSRKLRISVEDLAAGRVRVREFEYPEGPLGEYNYPAIVAAVDSMLEAGSLSFLLLDGSDDRWEFFLTDGDTVGVLRDEFGERVSVFDRPLLAPDGPAAFAEGSPEWAVDRLPDSVIGDPDDDTAESIRPENSLDSSADVDGPAWLRDAVAREGGIEEVIASLSEGPRTHVSDRSADDVIAEVPGRPAAGGRTTRGNGVDDVIERIGTAPEVESGPVREVSDRSVEVPWSDEEAAEEGVDVTESPSGRVESMESPETAAFAGSNSLSGGDVEEVVVEGGVDELLDAVGDDATDSLGTDDPPGHDEEEQVELNGLFASLEDAAEDVGSPSSESQPEPDEENRETEDTVDVEDVVEMVDNGEAEAPFAGESVDDPTSDLFADISEQADTDPDAVLADESGELSVDDLIEEPEQTAESPASPAPEAEDTDEETPDAVETPLIVDAETGTAVAGGTTTEAAVETGSKSPNDDDEADQASPDPSTIADVVREGEDDDPDEETVEEAEESEGTETESGVIARVRSLLGRVAEETLPGSVFS
jgi:hypothetical protein